MSKYKQLYSETANGSLNQLSGSGNLVKLRRAGIEHLIIALQRGIPSKRKSSACVDYVPALCTHRPSLLPIECLVRLPDWFREGATPSWNREASQTWSFRGSKSRNKVSVGEPAEGSLQNEKCLTAFFLHMFFFFENFALVGLLYGPARD
ncbi:unnamed protein product [Candida parapsilosis]